MIRGSKGQSHVIQTELQLLPMFHISSHTRRLHTLFEVIQYLRQYDFPRPEPHELVRASLASFQHRQKLRRDVLRHLFVVVHA